MRIISIVMALGVALFGAGWLPALAIGGNEAAQATMLSGFALIIGALVAMIAVDA